MKDAIIAGLLWLFGNILWDLVLIGVFGSFIGWLARKKSEWANPVLYFLITAACILLVAYTLVGRPLLFKEPPKITGENVDSNIQAWAANLGVGIQKQQNDKYKFSYRISLLSGRIVSIGRPNNKEGYLQFEGDVALGPDHIAFLQKATPAQKERISDEVQLEMARSKLGYITVLAPFNGIAVTELMPINRLTEEEFATKLYEMDSAVLLIGQAINLAFFHNGMTTPEAMLHPPSSQ